MSIQKTSSADWFAQGFGNAVSDIRQRLVEEGWFGRSSAPGTDRPPSLSELMGWAESSSRSLELGQEPHQPTIDRGIDR